MFSAPGVYFQTIDRNRPQIARLHTDICGFVGYADRGPVDRPVKLRSWRQFLDAFGPPLEIAHTGHAVRLFFENGGAACYMMRVAASAAEAIRTASLVLPGAGGAPVAELRASYSAIGAARSEGTGPAATGPTSEPPATQADSPGSWGNRLSVMVQHGGLGVTETLPNQPEDGVSVRVASVAGFARGSHARLVQDGREAPAFGVIAALDPQLGEIEWQTPITGLGLDLRRPVRLETVEFSLVVALDGQEVARHRDLSLAPGHARFLPETLARESALIGARVLVDPAVLTHPGNWPAPGFPLGLSRGRDGLAEITRHDFLAALERLALIDEVSILAAPDLVLRAKAEHPEPDPALPADRCGSAEPPPAGVLFGEVFDASEGVPVRGARVRSAEVSVLPVMTDANGRFTLTGLPAGQASIRIDKAGYVSRSATAQVFAVPLARPARFDITPRTLPPALTQDEIHEVQQAMLGQGARGLYRIALLDPPPELLGIEEIRSWRIRFDSSFGALYWPWVVGADAGGQARPLPPSGAVAGLIARTDLAEGPHRAPANKRLRGIEALSHPVGDEVHGLLNGLGINCLRATPGRGIAPQGARTLSSDPEWRYLNVRRLVLMIAESIEDQHQWAVFEPNTRLLRDALTHSLTAFLAALWRAGALAGGAPESAFAVKCDEENNPPAVIDAGQVVAEIAIAPVRPYEFILLRLGRTDRIQVREQAGGRP